MPQLIAAHARADWMYGMCSGQSVGIQNPSGALLGCLMLPVGEPPKITALAVSQAAPCHAG
jgi:hypothetical protein